VIELHISEPVPSLNVVWGGHWSKRQDLRKRWGWLVRAARLQAKVFDPPNYPHATLTIERFGKTHLDHDNFVGGGKVLIDCLVRERLISGDSPAHIGEPKYIQHVGKQRGTIVRIEVA
jgi:hypothetical protein